MSLQVIGAGFGRTGTASMKAALERLGLGPCHHMFEVNANPSQRDQWRAVAAGAAPDWDAIFAGYGSAIDWPAAFYWRELSTHYPHAKILLTVRSPESWYKSASETIFRSIKASTDPDSLGVSLIAKQVFNYRLDDAAYAMSVFEESNRAVMSSFDESRLLVFNTGDGWAPLCRFLNVPIPDEPFPHSNTTAEMQARQNATKN